MLPKSDLTVACGNCGVEERRLLHYVRLRGVFRRLCTSCVLRLHPQSFCPTCFHVHPPPPQKNPQDGAVLTCTKCYSITHSRCVSSSPSSYICPLCTHPPGTLLFKLKSAKEANLDGNFTVLDTDAAKKLLAAAKIASNSMNAAAICARAEAEKRAREAEYARKKAKEALEYLAYVVDKMRRKENAKTETVGVVRRGNHSVMRGSINYNNKVSALREMSNVVAESGETNHGDVEMTNGDGNGEVVDADIGESVVVEGRTKNNMVDLSSDDAALMVDQKVNGSVNGVIAMSVDEVKGDGGQRKESGAVVEQVVNDGRALFMD